MNDARHDVDLIGRLADEFVERYRRGEQPSVTEYCQRHAELAPRIRAIFPSLMMIEEFAPDLADARHASLLSADGRVHAAPGQIGDYRILREIGRGGMGVVYEALQESLGRRVALKVLPLCGAADSKSLERFRGEARAAARLHHTNIVPIFEVGQEQGFSFIAMQFIQGQGLDALVTEQRTRSGERRQNVVQNISDSGEPLPSQSASARDALGHGENASSTASDGPPNWPSMSQADPRRYFRSVAQMGVQVAEALEYAHRRGVIHRDIKPSNLLLDASGVVWITDFGLAKIEEDAHSRTGDVVGTVRYMAPERFDGRSDPRSDVYGLGMTLYELLTMRPAFDSQQRAQLMQQVMHSDPPRPRRVVPKIPRDLETIVLKAIAREPSARFAAAGQMADDLRRFLSDQPIQARRVWLWERTWRWCLRNPAVAGLSALTLLVFLIGLSGVVWKWREAEQARFDERLARESADAEAEKVRQGALRLKEANALLDLGQVCVQNRRWDDAGTTFSKAIQLRPDHVRAWEDRGHLLFARLGLWELTADDLAAAFDLQPPSVAGRWWSHALLRAYVGDTDGYRRVGAEMQKRFGRTYSPLYSADLVRTLALIPSARGIDETIVNLAESVASNHTDEGVFSYVVALAKCRAGDHAEAIKRCHDSLQATPPWSARALNYPILAIAHHELGQDAEARDAMDQLAGVVNDWTQQMYQHGPDRWVTSLGATGYWPVSCWDWLECQHYDREARRRLSMETVEDYRLHMLRARGFAGLRMLREADAEYELALKLTPQDVQVRLEAHRNRAYYLVSRKGFRAAAIEFANAGALAPDDSDLWRFQAFAHTASGDLEAYRTACRAMVARFKNTQDCAVAYDVVEACVAHGDSLDDMSQLIPLARLGATWYVGGVRILGAAHCRAGHFEDAVGCYQAAARLTRLSSSFALLGGHCRDVFQGLGDFSTSWAGERE
jgi:serine/threonine protein kinase/tetratricopeptide (TPR) repeat protein